MPSRNVLRLHKQSFIHKIYANGRGGLACPPVTCCVCTNNHLSIKFMQTIILWRKAVTVLQDGTVGRIYKSAPTVFVNSMAQAVTFG